MEKKVIAKNLRWLADVFKDQLPFLSSLKLRQCTEHKCEMSLDHMYKHHNFLISPDMMKDPKLKKNLKNKISYK